MALFIEIRNARTDELVGIRSTKSDAMHVGAAFCGTDGFVLTRMEIPIEYGTIVKLLGGYGGFATKADCMEYAVSEDGTCKKVN